MKYLKYIIAQQYCAIFIYKVNVLGDEDYETYRTGRYIPGMMRTLLSFVDKLISSLSTTIIGLVVEFIGHTNGFPQI
ncbi:hypothetical protein [Pseudostreptobacillus hongkongensis]|uniref:hypothetical protein n=1 Tax=Pseudostreptobacillus hongkongensis TaxID=1162717 RepID=UPI000836925C|nr:hypothetical protein [Pseudostreptobacillus hongkongensis]